MAESKPTWHLRAWRNHRGLTQEALANACGMHKGDVSSFETGRRQWSERHLANFAAALNVEPWWLVDVDPMDEANDLELLELIRRLPKDRKDDAKRILAALINTPQPSDAPPPKRRRGSQT